MSVVGLESSARSLNKKIQLFNLIVPIMSHQLLLFRLDVEIEKALKMPRVEIKETSIENEKRNLYSKDENLFGMLANLFRWS